jgi:hypothetical protein
VQWDTTDSAYKYGVPPQAATCDEPEQIFGVNASGVAAWFNRKSDIDEVLEFPGQLDYLYTPFGGERAVGVYDPVIDETWTYTNPSTCKSMDLHITYKSSDGFKYVGNEALTAQHRLYVDGVVSDVSSIASTFAIATNLAADTDFNSIQHAHDGMQILQGVKKNLAPGATVTIQHQAIYARDDMVPAGATQGVVTSTTVGNQAKLVIHATTKG